LVQYGFPDNSLWAINSHELQIFNLASAKIVCSLLGLAAIIHAFNISVTFLKNLWESQKGLCALTGLKMEHSINKGKLFNNISIDRINSFNGYTENNVQLVCSVVNRMKSNLSLEQFYNVCKLITNNYEK